MHDRRRIQDRVRETLITPVTSAKACFIICIAIGCLKNLGGGGLTILTNFKTKVMKGKYITIYVRMAALSHGKKHPKTTA